MQETKRWMKSIHTDCRSQDCRRDDERDSFRSCTSVNRQCKQITCMYSTAIDPTNIERMRKE